MTWTQIGWTVIGLSAVLLIVFSILFKGKRQYKVRKFTSPGVFQKQRVAAIERGQARHLVLGDQFWSRSYPALGLHALATLPSLATSEDLLDGEQLLSAGAGELVLFARQIVEGHYQGGFSTHLPVFLPGPTPFSFLAGFIPETGLHPPGSVGMFGNFGLTAALLSEAVELREGQVFAAAGSITAQAALFMKTQDLLIGEEVFLLPGGFEPTAVNQAGWVTEDIIRLALMILLVIAAGLKMAGVI